MRDHMELLKRRILTNFPQLKSAQAQRVIHWLKRLNEHNLTHDAVGIVQFGSAKSSVIGTVDYKTGELGCAWCGEFAAESGQPIDKDFKLIGLCAAYLPYDIVPLNLRPHVLYCDSCFAANLEWFERAYELDADSYKTAS